MSGIEPPPGPITDQTTLRELRTAVHALGAPGFNPPRLEVWWDYSCSSYRALLMSAEPAICGNGIGQTFGQAIAAAYADFDTMGLKVPCLSG